MRALLAWELGANLGHISTLLDIAEALSKQGWKISMALRNPDALSKFEREHKFSVFQAPCKQIQDSQEKTKPHLPNSYIEDLIPCGYDDPELLQQLIESWIILFEQTNADILIAESAPTAILAARNTSLKRINLGSDYSTPPLSDPLPPLRYWRDEETSTGRLKQQDILRTINKAMAKLDLKPLLSVAEALKPDRNFICSFEEFDHYPKNLRDSYPEKYYGPLQAEASGQAIKWRDDVQHRILAYIVAGTPSFQNCLNALRSTPDSFDIIYICPSFSESVCQDLAKSNMRVFNHPIPLSPLLDDCDLLISNGNTGVTTTATMNGIPALMFPSHIEQNMFARALCRNNLGQMLVGEFSIEDLMTRIRYMLNEKSIKESSLQLAEKYAWFDPKTLPQVIAEEISRDYSPTRDKS